MKNVLFLLLIGIVLSNNLYSSNYMKVKVEFDSSFTLDKFLSLEMIDNCSSPKISSYAEIIINKFEYETLKKHTDKIEIIVDDMEEFYANQIKNSKSDELLSNKYFQFGSMGYFYKLDEIYKEFDKIMSKYPTFFTHDTIGYTYEKRPIIAYKMSIPTMPPAKKPGILLTALHHAREPVSAMTLVYYFWNLIERIENEDKSALHLIAANDYMIIPVVNPDGYFYNQTIKPEGGGLWRKNRKPVDTLFGIDLNRNYGPNEFWNYPAGGSSLDPRYDNYRGDTAFSELETKAIAKFCQNHQVDIAINLHTYGDVIVYPWGYKSIETNDSTYFIGLSRHVNSKNNFDFGSPLRTVNYVARGGSDDWMYWGKESTNSIYAMTPEVGDFIDGFWPPKENVIKEMDNASLLIEKAILSSNEFLVIDKYEFDESTSMVKLRLQNIGLKTSDYNNKITLDCFDENISIENNTIKIPSVNPGQFYDLNFTLSPNSKYQNGSKVKFATSINGFNEATKDTFQLILKKSIPINLYNGESQITEFVSDSLWGIYNDPKSNTNYISCNIIRKANKYPYITRLTSNDFEFSTAKALSVEFNTKWFIERNFDFGCFDVYDYKNQVWKSIKTNRMHLGKTFKESKQDTSLYGLDGYFPLFELLKADLTEYLPKFKIRFSYMADNNSQSNEWLIKNINLKVFEDLTDVESNNQHEGLVIKKDNNQLSIFNDLNSNIQFVAIYDINGKMIMSDIPTSSNKINYNINEILTGIYLIQVKTDKKNYFKKFIIN